MQSESAQGEAAMGGRGRGMGGMRGGRGGRGMRRR
jgi:T-complex protein 1 subunit eta